MNLPDAMNLSDEYKHVLAHSIPPAFIGEDGKLYWINYFGVKCRIWTNSERVAEGWEPLPENFIQYGLDQFKTHKLAECEDDEL